MKLLIVDDSRMSRNMIKRALPDSIRQRAELVEASNGAEAVEAYKAHMPDLVFLDLTMPVMDGYEALVHIIQHDPGAVVIVVSADVQPGAVERATALGAIRHLRKPIAPEVLQPIVFEVLTTKVAS